MAESPFTPPIVDATPAPKPAVPATTATQSTQPAAGPLAELVRQEVGDFRAWLARQPKWVHYLLAVAFTAAGVALRHYGIIGSN